MRGARSSRKRCGRRVRGDGARMGRIGRIRRVLPVTPFPLWCLVPVKQSGAGDDDAGWVLSLQSTPIRFGFPRAVPRAASFLQVPREGEAAMPAKKKEKDADGNSAGAVAEHGGAAASARADR